MRIWFGRWLKLSMVVHVCSVSTREAKTTRDLELGRQSSLITKCQLPVRERPCLKKRNGRLLRSDSPWSVEFLDLWLSLVCRGSQSAHYCSLYLAFSPIFLPFLNHHLCIPAGSCVVKTWRIDGGQACVSQLLCTASDQPDATHAGALMPSHGVYAAADLDVSTQHGPSRF